MSMIKDAIDYTRHKLHIAATRAKFTSDLMAQNLNTGISPAGSVQPRINQRYQQLVEREDVNLATCVRIISDAVAWLPLNVKQKTVDQFGNEVLEVDSSHPFNDLWLEPNPDNTTSDVTKHIVESLLLTGNSYLSWQTVVGESEPGKQYDIDPKPSPYMTVKVNKTTKRIESYIEKQPFNPVHDIEWKKENIVHHRLYNINDPVYGRSGVEPLRNSLWTEYQAEMMNLGFFLNDGTPRSVFTPDTEVTPVQQEQIEKFFFNRSNPDDKNRLQILPVPGKVDAVQQSQEEMQFIEMRKYNRERTFGILGIPPFLGGIMEHANYANALIQEASFWRHTMIPMVNLVADVLTRRLMWELYDRDHKLEYNLDNVQALHGDQVKKAKKGQILIAAGIWSQNDARTRDYGMDPDPDPRSDELRRGLKDGTTPSTADEPAAGNPAGDDKSMKNVNNKAGIVTVRSRDTNGKVISEVDVDDDIFIKAQTVLDRRIDKYGPALEKQMRIFWKGQEKRVLKQLREVTSEGRMMSALFPHVISKGGNPLDDFISLEAEKLIVAEMFAPLIAEFMEEIGQTEAAKAQAAGGLGVDFDIRNPKAQAALDQILNKISATNDTTFKDIKRIMFFSYENNLTVNETAKLIADKYTQYSLTRATTIARTTTTSMSNVASRLAWQDNGATHKMWVAVHDPKTRDYHVAYNGERVRIDDYFKFGPEPMMEPGDPNAQLAGNVVNCRCGIIFDFNPVEYLTELLDEELAA